MSTCAEIAPVQLESVKKLREYLDACTNHEMLLTSVPPQHRITCTDKGIEPYLDAIEREITERQVGKAQQAAHEKEVSYYAEWLNELIEIMSSFLEIQQHVLVSRETGNETGNENGTPDEHQELNEGELMLLGLDEIASYDRMAAERHRAAWEIARIDPESGTFVKNLAKALDVEWSGHRVRQSIAAIQHRLVYLLSEQSVDLSEVSVDNHS